MCLTILESSKDESTLVRPNVVASKAHQMPNLAHNTIGLIPQAVFVHVNFSSSAERPFRGLIA